MLNQRILIWASAAIVLVGGLAAQPDRSAARSRMMQSPVPADQVEAARALKSPLPASPEVVAAGKALYHGKGTCVTCHGETGAGDGPAGKGLTPPPRNFQHHGFWRHRTDGELFYIIQHGSAGTGMPPFGSILTEEEIWSVIQYERTFSRHHGPRRGMGGMNGMGGRGRMQAPDAPPDTAPAPR